MEQELKPCPFCGGAGEIKFAGKSDEYVCCADCGATSTSDRLVLTVAAWNQRTRTPDPEARALLEEIREDLQISATVPLADPYILVELRALCEQHGYGNVMASASALWRQRLGDQAGGEFVASPCRSTVEGQIKKIEAYLTRTDGGDHG